MTITVTIESDEPFEPEELLEWLNREFAMANMATGTNMVATEYEIKE